MGDKPVSFYKVDITAPLPNTLRKDTSCIVYHLRQKKKIVIDSISVMLVECFTYSHVMLIIGVSQECVWF